MKKIFTTDQASYALLIARVALGIVLFAHGAQKLLGWFGGDGFNSTMSFLTHDAGLPWVVAFMVIIIEFFGSLLLILGAGTRIAAIGVLCTFTGIVVTSHLHAGFFANWGGEAQKEEGLEYFILLFALALVALIAGAGKWSVDAQLAKKLK